MNSVQTLTLNSALSQNWVVCTVRTPRNQVARTLHAQCPSRGRCCVHGRLVVRMSRAQLAQVARSSCVGRAHSAQVVGASRDLLPLPSSRPGRDTETRSRPSWRLTYVTTSISCRDLVSSHSGISRSRRQNPGRDLPHCHPCRDLKMMSRPQAQPSQVVTSKPGRDQPPFPSQNVLVATQKTLVATPNLLSLIQPGRDAHFWLRP